MSTTSVTLQHLQVFHYKNYPSAELDFSPKVNCFLGKNGSGKTNLLDAIYSLSFCRSFLSSIDAHSIKQGESEAAVHGDYQLNDEEVRISYQLFTDKKKAVLKNSKSYDRLSEHIGFIPLVLVTPNDIDLIRESSDVRRRWLDQTLSQSSSDYLSHLVKYKHILDQRNALLKNNRYSLSDLKSFLEMYDEQLAEHGTHIFHHRQQFFEAFIPVFENIYQRLSGNDEQPKLTYETEISGTNFLDLLKRSFENDIHAERTAKGIHKDDLEFELQGISLKKFASQGQQKTFLLALKLAQFEYTRTCTQKTPVLLLDDLAEKLDLDRLRSLLIWLKEETQAQLFLSDTDLERIPNLLREIRFDFRAFEVASAHIHHLTQQTA